MFRKPTLKMSLQQLGLQVLDDEALKAVMISKDEAGDVVITLVEGIEESHKVKFGRIERQSRTLIPSLFRARAAERAGCRVDFALTRNLEHRHARVPPWPASAS